MTEELNNGELIGLLKKEVEAFNRYRESNPDQPMDFFMANLLCAYLTGANLQGANLQGANLRDAYLRSADLTGANLQGANLRGAKLRDANLTDADLTNADLRGVKFSLAKLKGAKLPYNAPAVPGIHNELARVVTPENLDMENWHSSCGTTHCRAGWVVALAGEKGRELEAKVMTEAAAALIYMASDPDLEQIPDFYADNEDALADIQAMAEASR